MIVSNTIDHVICVRFTSYKRTHSISTTNIVRCCTCGLSVTYSNACIKTGVERPIRSEARFVSASVNSRMHPALTHGHVSERRVKQFQVIIIWIVNLHLYAIKYSPCSTLESVVVTISSVSKYTSSEVTLGCGIMNMKAVNKCVLI